MNPVCRKKSSSQGSETKWFDSDDIWAMAMRIRAPDRSLPLIRRSFAVILRSEDQVRVVSIGNRPVRRQCELAQCRLIQFDAKARRIRKPQQTIFDSQRLDEEFIYEWIP